MFDEQIATVGFESLLNEWVLLLDVLGKSAELFANLGNANVINRPHAAQHVAFKQIRESQPRWLRELDQRRHRTAPLHPVPQSGERDSQVLSSLGEPVDWG